MALTARLSLAGPPESDPEDFLATSLGVIFPDDVTNRKCLCTLSTGFLPLSSTVLPAKEADLLVDGQLGYTIASNFAATQSCGGRQRADRDGQCTATPIVA